MSTQLAMGALPLGLAECIESGNVALFTARMRLFTVPAKMVCGIWNDNHILNVRFAQPAELHPFFALIGALGAAGAGTHITRYIFALRAFRRVSRGACGDFECGLDAVWRCRYSWGEQATPGASGGNVERMRKQTARAAAVVVVAWRRGARPPWIRTVARCTCCAETRRGRDAVAS